MGCRLYNQAGFSHLQSKFLNKNCLHVFVEHKPSSVVRLKDSCTDPESFVKGGPTLTVFFFSLVDGREDPNTTKSRAIISTPAKTIEGPTLNASLVDV